MFDDKTSALLGRMRDRAIDPIINLIVGFATGLFLTALSVILTALRDWQQPNASLSGNLVEKILSLTGDKPLVILLALSLLTAAMSLIFQGCEKLRQATAIIYNSAVFAWGILIGIIIFLMPFVDSTAHVTTSVGVLRASCGLVMLAVSTALVDEDLKECARWLRIAIVVGAAACLAAVILFYGGVPDPLCD
ncbi:MAG: hypothetical protein KBG46_12710 [Paracoccus sp.]|nr:hypothetical protein [Paracoccus sp. (in: a-proteobacteria)]